MELPRLTRKLTKNYRSEHSHGTDHRRTEQFMVGVKNLADGAYICHRAASAFHSFFMISEGWRDYYITWRRNCSLEHDDMTLYVTSTFCCDTQLSDTWERGTSVLWFVSCIRDLQNPTMSAFHTCLPHYLIAPQGVSRVMSHDVMTSNGGQRTDHCKFWRYAGARGVKMLRLWWGCSRTRTRSSECIPYVKDCGTYSFHYHSSHRFGT